MEYKKRPLRERFDAKHVRDSSGCWIWTAQKCQRGYGRIKINGKTSKAHRVAFEIYVGEIPHRLSVLHRCDNPSCVNPAHLFLGDHDANMRDMSSKRRGYFVSKEFKELGLTTAGSDNGRALLTENDVLAIRADQRAAKVIAADFGVSIAAIYDIRLRRRWRHL